MTSKFETGKTYYGRYTCNYDSIGIYTVERRTEKTVWVKDRFGKVSMRRVSQTSQHYESFCIDSLYITSHPTSVIENDEPEEIAPAEVEVETEAIVETIEPKEPTYEVYGDYTGTPINDTVDRVVIEWHEGYDTIAPGAEFGSFESAHEALKKIATKEKLESLAGGYYKVKVKIVFTDGREMSDRIDLSDSEGDSNPHKEKNSILKHFARMGYDLGSTQQPQAEAEAKPELKGFEYVESQYMTKTDKGVVLLWGNNDTERAERRCCRKIAIAKHNGHFSEEAAACFDELSAEQIDIFVTGILEGPFSLIEGMSFAEIARHASEYAIGIHQAKQEQLETDLNQAAVIGEFFLTDEKDKFGTCPGLDSSKLHKSLSKALLVLMGQQPKPAKTREQEDYEAWVSDRLAAGREVVPFELWLDIREA